ncbi:MAG: hypothetical protein AAF597_11325 [Bacteroidota bacterium]
MITRLLCILCLAVYASVLSAQLSLNPKLEVTAGLSTAYAFEDFSRTEFTRNGNTFTQGEGNIAEPIRMPFLRVGVSSTVGKRWELAPYLEYQAATGLLFEDGSYIFGVSDLNPEEKRYAFPSANAMRLFIGGIDARYALWSGRSTQFSIGSGLAFAARSHTYREELLVDFSTTYDIQSVTEEQRTTNGTSVALPFFAELAFQISDKVTLGLHGRLQFHLGLDDPLWASGLRFGIDL